MSMSEREHVSRTSGEDASRGEFLRHGDEILERARATRVVVIGGGMAGLVAAHECAKVAMKVTVLESAEQPGGAVRSGEVAGIALDLGAESFATRGGHVKKLVTELGLEGAIVAPGRAGAWVAGVPGVGAAPLPAGGVLGIPANPFADEVRAIIGWSGAWRAYLDRLRPVLTIGHAHSLGRLVRQRMGARVLDRLVAPVVSGVYSAHPDDIDPDIAAPGLGAAITRTGSLSGAVASLAEKRREAVGKGAPGQAALGLRGGMARLPEALAGAIRDLDGEVVTGARVERLERNGDGWRVVAAQEHHADVVIVATDEDTARRLLADHVPGLSADAPSECPVVEIITLVLETGSLDEPPRGNGVLTVPGTFTAKALTHASAKWEWVAEAAGPGRHVVRVSFGTQNETPATAELSDDDAVLLALREASALLGVDLPASALVEGRRERFVQSQPTAAAGLKQQTDAARAAIRRTSALGVVGAWLSGTGLAQVVPDAIDEADRVRRQTLFRP
ncbi:MAG: protoporphyrinogen oxidase [Microbacterium sp.]